MAKSIKCNFCEKQATVHLTQIINNKIHKVDICEDCALEKGITDPEGFSLADILVKNIEKSAPKNKASTTEESIVCPISGTTFEDYKQSGRLGSAACYTLFREHLLPLMKNMHKGLKHTGKTPVNKPRNIDHIFRISELKVALGEAIREERFEDAATLRDQLQTLEKNRKEQG